jgi:hypothetical protein
MKLKPGIFLLSMTASLLAASCSDKKSREPNNVIDTANLTNLKFTVEPASEWTSLFIRNSGWFGGDGIFALTRNGKEAPGSAEEDEAIIWFSDTMIGEIAGDSLQPGSVMINNSVAIVQNGRADSTVKFVWDKTPDNKPKSVFIPNTPATTSGDYYWLGDGFVNHKRNNNIHIFGYRIRTQQANNAFGFKEVGNTLITIPAGSQPPFHDKRQLDIPFFLGKDVDSTGSFGAGVLVNTEEAGAPNPDGYIYVYGVRGKNKGVMVARVLPENIEVFDRWTFWNGKEWSKEAESIQTVTDRASNELSVTPLPDGRYALVFQADGLGKYVGLRLANSPVGPFGPVINVYDVTNDLEKDKDIFPYNAKAHPVLSKPGELLISYNVNSFDFFSDIKTFPHLYRPRFIRLKYELD